MFYLYYLNLFHFRNDCSKAKPNQLKLNGIWSDIVFPNVRHLPRLWNKLWLVEVARRGTRLPRPNLDRVWKQLPATSFQTWFVSGVRTQHESTNLRRWKNGLNISILRRSTLINSPSQTRFGALLNDVKWFWGVFDDIEWCWAKFDSHEKIVQQSYIQQCWMFLNSFVRALGVPCERFCRPERSLLSRNRLLI